MDEIDTALAQMQRDGVSAIEAAKTLRSEHGLPLGEAKRRIDAHPAWADIAHASENARDAAERALDA